MSKNMNENASDILLDKDVAKISYAKKDYVITRLKLKQMLNIIKIISSQYNIIQEAIINKSSKKELSSHETIIVIIENLDETQLFELLSIILNEDINVIIKGFSFADMLEVITTLAQLEDIEKIFFQITQVINLIPKVAGEDQRTE